MNVGFLFPGQGAQYIGMGKDLYDKYDTVKKTYNKVKEIVRKDIAKIAFEGPEDVLNETQNNQLAILTMSLSILEIFKENDIRIKAPKISAGLSLGEYTALINSNIISFEDGVRLVQKRGECMQKFLPEGEWQMAAVMGISDLEVENICKKIKSGFVTPANYNYNGQIVISGEKKAVLEAGRIAKEIGAKKIVFLKTTGPFHTEKLMKAADAFKGELEKVKINKINSKVIKNLDGEVYKNTDNVRNILTKHIISPVKFSKTIENMLSEGIDTFIEIGPRKNTDWFCKENSK